MAEADHLTIKLGKWADELQILLANTREVVRPMEEEPAPSANVMYLQFHNGRTEQEQELECVNKPAKIELGPKRNYNILPNIPKESSLALAVLRTSRNELFLDELKRYYYGVNSVVEKLRGAYHALDQMWPQQDNYAFVRMMLTDGLFVLEVIDTVIHPHDNPVIKRMFENEENKKGCLHDILLLENQLPIHLLITLRRIQRGFTNLRLQSIDDEEERSRLVLDIACTFRPSNRPNFVLSDMITTDYFDSALNILDVYRRYLVHHKFKEEKGGCTGLIWKIFKPKNDRLPTQNKLMKYNIFEYIPTATKLQEAGIRFKTNASGSLLDIHFSSKTLTLPEIVVDSYTKSLFLNLIAFEELHKHVAKNEVTSYLYFMRCLIRGVEDVTLLQSHGIIISTLLCADVAEILEKITYSFVDPNLSSEFMNTVIKVRERYNKMSNEWRKELFQTYLKSPCAMISLFGAISIFILAILQTLFSILSYTIAIN